ncbi:MAG: helix-turn-helix domain-containing protein [Vicinamibacterales bacterium]
MPVNPTRSPAQPRRRLLKLTRVAETLDCSLDTVDRLVRRGALPIVRLPSGRRRVTEEDLDRVIEDWKASR